MTATGAPQRLMTPFQSDYHISDQSISDLILMVCVVCPLNLPIQKSRLTVCRTHDTVNAHRGDEDLDAPVSVIHKRLISNLILIVDGFPGAFLCDRDTVDLFSEPLNDRVSFYPSFVLVVARDRVTILLSWIHLNLQQRQIYGQSVTRTLSIFFFQTIQ